MLREAVRLVADLLEELEAKVVAPPMAASMSRTKVRVRFCAMATASSLTGMAGLAWHIVKTRSACARVDVCARSVQRMHSCVSTPYARSGHFHFHDTNNTPERRLRDDDHVRTSDAVQLVGSSQQ